MRSVKAKMKSALAVIDLQNDITKNYRQIIDGVNRVIGWAQREGMPVAYVRNASTSEKSRTFRPGTRGFEFVPELDVASDLMFTKTKASVTTCPGFVSFLEDGGVGHIYLVGADATACIKSACLNLRKLGFEVTVVSDCVTSYALDRVPEMIRYYESKGCGVITSSDLTV